MTQFVKALRSGQITIPAALREKLGIDSDTFLKISLIAGELRIKPVKMTAKAQDAEWFQKLYSKFSEVRKEARIIPGKEIDRAIEKAIQAVRKSHAQSRH